MDFYLRQPTKLSEYFQAAWRYKHRAALGKRERDTGHDRGRREGEPKVSADGLADSERTGRHRSGLETPANVAGASGACCKDSLKIWLSKCMEMQDFVERIRKHTSIQFAAPIVKGLPAGSQPLLSWKNTEFASHRRSSDPQALRNDTDPPPVVPEIPKYPGLHRESAPRWAALMAKMRADDSDLVVPAAERKRYEAAFARFASVFPDRFYLTERGRYFPGRFAGQGATLSAGYHSVLGFFRDDIPLMELILDEKGKEEIDRLWDEFDYIASFTARTWVQYYFNQSGEVQGKGAESGTARPRIARSPTRR